MKTNYNTLSGKIAFDEAKEIARGGEGKIIFINDSVVAKVYLPNIEPISKAKFSELKHLNSHFVTPDDLLTNEFGHVKGFLMKKLGDDFFPLYSAYNKSFCKRNLITDPIKSSVVKTLIQSVKQVHTNKIVIGDLNPFNILMTSKGVVNFIDTDSYQTETEKHSGRLLDDVRDYLYSGNVSEYSDYFALAVITYNLLTFMHPF